MPLNYLVQNYIRLEPGPFRARPLHFLVQNVGPFTTPMHRWVYHPQKKTWVHLNKDLSKSVQDQKGIFSIYLYNSTIITCLSSRCHWWQLSFGSETERDTIYRYTDSRTPLATSYKLQPPPSRSRRACMSYLCVQIIFFDRFVVSSSVMKATSPQLNCRSSCHGTVAGSSTASGISGVVRTHAPIRATEVAHGAPATVVLRRASYTYLQKEPRLSC